MNNSIIPQMPAAFRRPAGDEEEEHRRIPPARLHIQQLSNEQKYAWKKKDLVCRNLVSAPWKIHSNVTLEMRKIIITGSISELELSY